MRPSIAAALSTLGPDHSADDVLLRPSDVSRFGDLEGQYGAVDRRVIERPDGSLILMLEFDPTGSGGYDEEEAQFALVGAVPKDAWTWADPKKRQPAPLARVNLDARDIHCLTQGGEIHRGATVGTTPTGLVALQAATPKPGAPVRPVAHATFTVDEFSRMLEEFGRTGKVTRTPKDGDAIGSLTVSDLDGLPVGARLEEDGWPPLVKVSATDWVSSNSSVRSGATVKALCFATRTLVLPKPAEAPKPAAPPKVGDRWGALNDDQRAALPAGTVLDGTGSLPPVVKVGSGWVCVEDGGKVGGFVPERTIAFLPVSK